MTSIIDGDSRVIHHWSQARTSPIGDVVETIRRGGMAVLVDDPGRENEGDLVQAAGHATAESVNFMATHARGLICVPMRQERLDALGIPPMVARGNDPHGTAFHVGVDLDFHSTGISATERAATIRALADSSTGSGEFRQPGHVFPLGCRPGGVLERPGHTEASVELARLAGLEPAAVICEIAGPTGEMMRMPQLAGFAAMHGLPLATVADVIAYVKASTQRVERVSVARLPLPQGVFHAVGYRDRLDSREHLALVSGDPDGASGVLVRMHSECLTGDVLGSLRCDCGQQLNAALDWIGKGAPGVVVYLRGHEGRGIGLLEKIRAYHLQDQGVDTVDANLMLGHPVDDRDYGVGAAILRDLGVMDVRLLTNNPDKCVALRREGIAIREAIPLTTDPTAANVRYLYAKQVRMGHSLQVAPHAVHGRPDVRV